MRILLLQETDWISRGPHTQHHLMERLSLKGHEIRVIDYNLLWKQQKDKRIFKKHEKLGNQVKIFKNARVELIRPAILQMPIFDYLSIPLTHHREIKKQILEFKPDVILSFGILNARVGAKLARKYKIPYVYYVIDHLHTLLPLRIARPVAKAFEKKNLKLADRVLVINKGLVDYAVDLGCDESKISIVPNGVDLARYKTNPKTRKELRNQYDINEKDTVLFFMGWLYDFSGLRDVAKTILERNNDDIKLMVVGSGDLFDELIKLKGDSARIILTVKQSFDKIPDFLSTADICLLPAHDVPEMQNIVPIKMYEYMAMGKPVIATRLPGIMKEFENDNGVIYIDNPEDTLFKALDLITTDSVNVEGKKAHEFAKGYDWNKITDDFEKVLGELL
ncbi:MAG: glycosyltransferase family 4 protein [Candidatus Methanoperedens sp.]|nr:glycosyltransferase family 4 protein [Candidatus Methanoperedens sp.]